MKKVLTIAMFLGLTALMFSSCTSMHQTMREPNSRVEWEKDDFSFSEQVTAEATSTRILMIDWSRLFGAKSGSVEGGNAMIIDAASIPVIGDFVVDPTAAYALYELMQANPGYDVVFYPQYSTEVKRPIGLGFIFKKTKVTVKARLAKL